MDLLSTHADSMGHLVQLNLANAESSQLSLTDSLVRQGELSLLKEDLSAAFELFDQAVCAAPADPKLFFRQGLALFDYGSQEGKEKTLLQAAKKFKEALTIKPDYFDAWHLWGKTLYLLGTSFREHHYFLNAQKNLHHAVYFSSEQPKEVLVDLFWDCGIVYSKLAEYSGEILELQLAIEAFQKCTALQELLPSDFWVDFGQACLQLALRVNDVRFYVKAINYFKQSTSICASCFKSWHSLAIAFKMLYTHTHDEDHFQQANECFTTAAQLKSQDSSLWLEWAQFLVDSGRRNQNIKRLRSSIEKAHHAYVCDPKQPLSLILWAEALASIGYLSEKLNLIYEAQNKIHEATLLDHFSPDISYSHGIVLLCLGHYFNDCDYYYQAIEKFQEGLSSSRTSHRLWHAMANTYALIGEVEGDLENFERARRFFIKAIDLKADSAYIFDYALALSKLGEITHQQKWLEQALCEFERSLSIQKNATYVHPEWLFQYACALDMMGNFYDEDSYYLRAIEIFSHVLTVDPEFSEVHHRLALAFSHLGELQGEMENFYRSLHHYRLAAKHDDENDQLILDWALTLINAAQQAEEASEADQCYREAEAKLTQAALLGHPAAYYHLGCLYCLLKQQENALHFLEKAALFDCLPSIEEILEDEWLEDLKATADFNEFLARLEKKLYRT